MALKYFVEVGAIVVHYVPKEDLRHVAKATGATQGLTFVDMEGVETFDPSLLGYVDEVIEEPIAHDEALDLSNNKLYG